MGDIKLTKLDEKDIPLVADLARITWNQHYPSIIGQEQVDYMLNLMYRATALRHQMNEKGDVFYAINKEGKAIGFISVRREEKDNWFLNKFYIDQEKASKGIGTRAFRQLLELLSPDNVTLTVNRKNYKSINFYFKNGFTIEEVKDFDIGNGFVMEDFIMKWKRNRT